MSSETVVGTDLNFEQEVLKAEIPVLVDFWAEWCAPCRMVAPALDEIAQEHKGRIKVVKVNVDQHLITPSRYSIRSIPTLLFFKGGELKETIIGAVPKNKIVEAIERYL